MLGYGLINASKFGLGRIQAQVGQTHLRAKKMLAIHGTLQMMTACIASTGILELAIRAAYPGGCVFHVCGRAGRNPLVGAKA